VHLDDVSSIDRTYVRGGCGGGGGGGGGGGFGGGGVGGGVGGGGVGKRNTPNNNGQQRPTPLCWVGLVLVN